MLRMIDHFVNSLGSGKAAVTSIIAVMTGQVMPDVSVVLNMTELQAVNTGFQHAAWITAIVAGLVAIVNGVRKWIPKKQEYSEEDDE